jgi:hypothetical protein
MDKILVEIYLPVLSKSYDVFIPVKSRLYEIGLLLSNTFKELSENYFGTANDIVICDRTTGVVLNQNMSVEELGLRNGSKLMYI